jgi:prephenate dehydrogenase
VSSAAIIGLGLVGGSLARDLAAHGWRVVGHDCDADVLEAARRSGVLNQSLGSDLEGLEDVDVTVLAVPVQEGPQLLRLLQPRLGASALVLDVGSTKRAICAQAEALGLGTCFVGAHPFVGDHRSGWAASRTGLFCGARVFLCPLPTTPDAVLERARELWHLLDARTEVISADAHDAQLAWSSHLPQLVSSALAGALHSAGILPQQLGRGGRDVTRLAASDPQVWTGIVLENAGYTVQALALLERCLADLRRHIESSDEAAIRAAFVRASRWARANEPT